MNRTPASVHLERTSQIAAVQHKAAKLRVYTTGARKTRRVLT